MYRFLIMTQGGIIRASGSRTRDADSGCAQILIDFNIRRQRRGYYGNFSSPFRGCRDFPSKLLYIFDTVACRSHRRLVGKQYQSIFSFILHLLTLHSLLSVNRCIASRVARIIVIVIKFSPTSSQHKSTVQSTKYRSQERWFSLEIRFSTTGILFREIARYGTKGLIALLDPRARCPCPSILRALQKEFFFVFPRSSCPENFQSRARTHARNTRRARERGARRISATVTSGERSSRS